MKVKAHIRVARDPRRPSRTPKLVATATPSHTPLQGTNGTVLPTVAFAVEFDIPDAKFREAAQVIAEVKIRDAQVVADVKEIVQ